MFSASPSICAGIIVAPHGICGHVKVKCFLEDPTRLQEYSPFSDEQGKETYKVDKILGRTKDMLTISLAGVADRTAAEALRGVKLMFARDHLPALSEDTFYHTDLIGLQVLSSENQPVGVVHALYNFGAGDILEIQIGSKKLEMIPFSHAIVPEIDLKKGTIILSSEGDDLLQGGKNDA